MAFLLGCNAGVPAWFSDATYWVSICYHCSSPFIRSLGCSRNCNNDPCSSGLNCGYSHDLQYGLQVDYTRESHPRSCRYNGQFHSSFFPLLVLLCSSFGVFDSFDLCQKYHAEAAAVLTSCSACLMSKCFMQPRNRRLIEGLTPATNFDCEGSQM
jgi:hypothetical protein